MALRILLADESLNIKKNLQIALQDFGVEVKVVVGGDEVLSVTKAFRPDLIMLDILLPKVNGYDACAQIKNHPDFRHIPVILLWSSFMFVDQSKLRQSKADEQLEKPFDKESLRKLVRHFVPKTKSQTLSDFLTFPNLKLDGDDEINRQEDFQDLPHFQPKEIKMSPPITSSSIQPKVPEISPLSSHNDEIEEWVPHPLMKSSPPIEDQYEVEIARVQIPPEDPISAAPELDTLPVMGRPRRQTSPPIQYAGPPPQIQLDQKHLDELIRSELKSVIEQVISKTLPEIAERVIREEIARLMQNAEDEI